MTIINQSALESAKVMLVFDKKPALPQLTKYAQYVKELGSLLYISITDSPKDFTKKGIQKSVVADSFSQIHEIAKQGSVNIVVDTKGELFKFLGRDSSLWKERGVFVHDGVKYICGERWDSIRRECVSKKLVESEFEISSCKKVLINSEEKLKQFGKVMKASKNVAYDSETNSLRFEEITAKLVTMQFTGDAEPDVSYIFDPRVYDRYVEEAILWTFYNKRIWIHNSGFDVPWLMRFYGLDVYKCDIYDSMWIYAMLTNHPNRVPKGLKHIAFTLGVCDDWETPLEEFKDKYCQEHKLKKGDFTYDLIPNDILYEYAALDTVVLLRLLPHLYHMSAEHPAGDIIKITWEDARWKDVLKSTLNMMFKGIPANVPAMKKMVQELLQEKEELSERILANDKVKEAEELLAQRVLDKKLFEYKLKCEEREAQGKVFRGSIPEIQEVKFNPNSTDHMRTLLYDVLGLTAIKQTATGADSADKHTIAEFVKEFPNIEVLGLFGRYSEIEKMVTAYLKPFIQYASNAYDGRIHASFQLIFSGRFSCTNPNLMQLQRESPVKYTLGYEPEEGRCIIGVDFNSLEDRLAVLLSKDEVRLKMMEAKIEDAHSFNAIALFPDQLGHLDQFNPTHLDEVKNKYRNLRQETKGAVFALQYLGSHKTLMRQFKLSEKKALEIYNNYWETYKGVKQFVEEHHKRVLSQGYDLLWMFGNWPIRLDGIETLEPYEKAAWLRTCYNAAAGQSGAYRTHMGMVAFDDWVQQAGIDAYIINTVHDALYVDCKVEDAELVTEKIKEFMEVDFLPDQVFSLSTEAEIGYTIKNEFGVFEKDKKEVLRKMNE